MLSRDRVAYLSISSMTYLDFTDPPERSQNIPKHTEVGHKIGHSNADPNQLPGTPVRGVDVTGRLEVPTRVWETLGASDSPTALR
jgi:hypothetical protein